MKGFIKRSVALLWVGGMTALATGCCDKHLCDCYDNCWPERYNYQAAMSVSETFGAQVNNGHVLDQTVWTYHFEPGSAVLTKGGLEHLAYLARRRPAPDPHIFLQTAQDVPYDPTNPENLAEFRCRLNEERKVTILRFLNAETQGRPCAFEVTIHDPGPVGLPAPPAAISVRLLYGNFRGGLYGIGGVGGVGVAPGVP
jgi:hypothetical protein